MMRAPFSLILLLATLACSPAPETVGDGPESQPAASVSPATSSAEAEAIAQGQADAADAVAAQSANIAWTGRFAATPELCVQGVWDIKPHAIVTDGHTACDIDNVAEGAGGQVTLRLSCVAEGTASNESWTLTPRPQAGLSVARDTGREKIDVDLIRCG